MKITVSVIKADVGGVGGHTKPSDALIQAIRDTVKNSADLLIDYYIGYCGDDTHIVMSHTHGVDNEKFTKWHGMHLWQEPKLPKKKDFMVQDKIC